MRRHVMTALAGLLLLLTALPSPFAAQRPLVIFFGGDGSTEADMRLWKKSAAADPRYGKLFEFEAIAYPDRGYYRGQRTTDAMSETTESIVARIRKMGGRRVVLVGHSFGNGTAANVASRLGDLDNVKLISLDSATDTKAQLPAGYRPIRHFECWAAESNSLTSAGFRLVKNLCGEHAFVLHNDRCATSTCLHFALVNRHSDANLTAQSVGATSAGISGGYRDFAVELSWLDRSR